MKINTNNRSKFFFDRLFNNPIRFNLRVSSFLIYLLPFFLLIGPALPDIAIVITSILIFTEIIYYKNFKYFNNFYFKFFIFFYFFLIFSSLISKYPISSLESSVSYLRFIFLPIIIWFLIENNKNFLKYFFIFLFITYTFALFSGIYQYIFSETIFGFERSPPRIYLLASDNALLGHYLSRLFPLLVGLFIFFFRPKLIYYCVILVFFVTSDIVIFLSGERTALGLMFLSSIFIILFMSKFKYTRIMALLFSITVIIIISIYNPSIKERNLDMTIEQLGLSSNSDQIYLFSPEHHSLYLTSINMFLDKPFFGVGPNNFREHCNEKKYKINKYSCSTHPHNTYFQILAEIGIFGLIFISIILMYLSYKLLLHVKSIFYKNNNRLDDLQICLFACFLLSLFPLLPSLNFFTNWINIIYYLPIGFFLHTIYSKNYKKSYDDK